SHAEGPIGGRVRGPPVHVEARRAGAHLHASAAWLEGERAQQLGVRFLDQLGLGEVRPKLVDAAPEDTGHAVDHRCRYLSLKRPEYSTRIRRRLIGCLALALLLICTAC